MAHIPLLFNKARHYFHSSIFRSRSSLIKLWKYSHSIEAHALSASIECWKDSMYCKLAKTTYILIEVLLTYRGSKLCFLQYPSEPNSLSRLNRLLRRLILVATNHSSQPLIVSPKKLFPSKPKKIQNNKPTSTLCGHRLCTKE